MEDRVRVVEEAMEAAKGPAIVARLAAEAEVEVAREAATTDLVRGLMGLRSRCRQP